MLLVFITVAVNCWVWLIVTIAVIGLIETDISELLSTCTVAVANADGSATLVAVMVTGPEGTVAGAVYRPMSEIEPKSPGGPVTFQVTAVLLVFITEAENC
jgi:hypothetical protein